MAMKIIPATKDAVYPDDEKHYYIHGSNGTFLSMNTDMVEATVRAKEVSGLEEVKAYARWKLPIIPADTFATVAWFFREVARKHKTEVGAMLHFDFKNQKFKVSIPEQKVSAAHITYTGTERFPGYRLVGTMHSHVDMAAGHSSVDIQDEAEFDGIHVTIGHVSDYPEIDVDAELVIRGSKFGYTSALFAKQVAQGLEVIGKAEREYEGSQEEVKTTYGYSYHTRAHKPYMSNTHLVRSNLRPAIPKEWWDAVKVEKWSNVGWRRGGGEDDFLMF